MPTEPPSIPLRTFRYRKVIATLMAAALLLGPFPYAAAQTPQDCLEERIQTEPYRSNFAQLEQALLDDGRLPSADGPGYLALARATIEQGDLNYLLPPGLDLTLADGETPACTLELTEPPKGLVGQLIAANTAIAQARDLSPQLLVGTFLDHFPAEDWEQPLTKHLFYLYITLHALPDYGILDRLPPWTDEAPVLSELDPRNVLSVLVDAENRILVRGEEMPLDQLRTAAKQFIANPNKDPTLAESPTQAIIALQNDRRTIYATYLAVYNELRDAYRELWDAYSRAKFGRPYNDDLPVELKKQVREAIPFGISESTPTGN